MADDDNFDIDIYGDDTSPDFQQDSTQAGGEVKQEDTTEMQTDTKYEEPNDTNDDFQAEPSDQPVKQENGHSEATNGNPSNNGTQQISSTGGSAPNHQLPKQAPKQQGTKRKQGDDDRPLDPGASSALLISDLHWWINEEDVRGWANQSSCEDELIDVTFNEHKVNGKSKGQVYVEMRSPQAATALKHQLESYYQDQTHTKKPSAVFNPAHINPFKTLPKDVPGRDKNRQDNRSSSGNFGGSQGGQGGQQNNFNQGNRFGGNRGNFQNRGGMGNNMGNFQNRNFSSPVSNMNMGGGYNNQGAMGGFGGGPMGGMNNFNNFGRGGNMMGGMRGGMPNRGGRGGMGMGGNMGMGMGGMGMGMGGMGGNMGMMGGNMGMMGGMGPGGFGGNAQPHFNPAFFQGNQGGGDGNWNPHGAKRPRPE